MPKTYIFHDGKMWGRKPHTKAELLALRLPLSTPIIEVGGSGTPITLDAICGSLTPSAGGTRHTAPTPTPAPAARQMPAQDVNAQQLAVLRDIASNMRVLTWLAIIPWIVALAGLVLWFLAR